LKRFLTENPKFLLLLALTPALFVTTDLVNAVTMSILTLAVLLFSTAAMAAIAKFIPHRIHLISRLVIIAGFVTLLEMLLNAYFVDLARQLNALAIPVIPLIVVNCVILSRANAKISKIANPIISDVANSAIAGLGFAAILIITAIFRELLGGGTIWGISVFGNNFAPASILKQTPGAFLILGILLAAINAIVLRRRRGEPRSPASDK